MLIAIVGRPNVGKSTLFNQLLRDNRAIVGPERGITRDRIYGRWHIDGDHTVDIVDTGGYDSVAEGSIGISMREQTLVAIKEADLILCVLDARDGVTRDDYELIEILRNSRADIIYAANKVDDPNADAGIAQLYELGLDGFIGISAKNRRLDGLIDEVKARLDKSQVLLPDERDHIRVSILGRPNVGKSALLNRIIGRERSIVSPVAGTTRDYVDTSFEHGGRKYLFIDTAGIRRKSRIDTKLEKVSVMRSIHNVERSHVCLCLMDATESVTDQDRHLMGIVQEHARACAIVINKVDLIDEAGRKTIRDRIDLFMRFAADTPVILLSALTGKNVSRLFSLINDLFDKTSREIPTPQLNRQLLSIVEKHQPPVSKNRRIKFYYITQTGIIPPRFRIVTNRPEDIPESYSRYLVKAIKTECGLEGIPVKIKYASRRKEDK
jgi:GTP-binding protein